MRTAAAAVMLLAVVAAAAAAAAAGTVQGREMRRATLISEAELDDPSAPRFSGVRFLEDELEEQKTMVGADFLEEDANNGTAPAANGTAAGNGTQTPEAPPAAGNATADPVAPARNETAAGGNATEPAAPQAPSNGTGAGNATQQAAQQPQEQGNGTAPAAPAAGGNATQPQNGTATPPPAAKGGGNGTEPAPAKGGAAGNSTAPPVRQAPGAAQNGTAPAQNGTAPAQNGTAPAQNGTAPAQNGTVPAHNGTEPAPKGGKANPKLVVTPIKAVKPHYVIAQEEAFAHQPNVECKAPGDCSNVAQRKWTTSQAREKFAGVFAPPGKGALSHVPHGSGVPNRHVLRQMVRSSGHTRTVGVVDKRVVTASIDKKHDTAKPRFGFKPDVSCLETDSC